MLESALQNCEPALRKFGLRDSEVPTDLVQRIRKVFTNRDRFLLDQPGRPNQVDLDGSNKNIEICSSSTCHRVLPPPAMTSHNSHLVMQGVC